MVQRTGQVFDLLDGQGRQLGQMRLERCDGGLLSGVFVPGPEFAVVERLFREFEDAVNSQSLSVVDRLDGAIAALRLHLRSQDDLQSLAVHDVQIWSDGNMSCRIITPAQLVRDGSPSMTQADAAVRP